MEKLTSRQEALTTLFEKWSAKAETEFIPLANALNRIPVGEYFALHSIPVVRASAMDGIAVDSSRFALGIPDTSLWQRDTDYVRADTGDDFDDRFDAVIKIEDADILPSGGLHIHEGIEVSPGMNVRGEGSSFKKGTKLIDSGLPLRPTDLVALAMGGVLEVEVYKKPRVAFIPTGSELIPIGAPLRRGCNYDTNSLMVKLTLEEMGAEPIMLPIVRDDMEKLSETLHHALNTADIVIINGGSSKGDEDFNTRLLATEGELLFHGVSAAPGKPMGMAMINGKPVINVAGPSVAAFYGLEWCIRPIVRRFLGLPTPEKVKIKGKLTRDFRGGSPIDFLCRVEVRRTSDGYTITPLDRGQADMPATMRTNAMYISPIGDKYYAVGDELEVELLRNIAEIPYDC